MPAAVPLAPERPPRRARYLIPLGTPRRGEILAAVAAAGVLAGALFAPLTLLLFAGFHTVSRITRWRPVWLLVPVCCGALWLLAIGAGTGVAAFARGTGSAGALLARVAADPPTLTGLPGAEAHVMAVQFPAALILAAAAAALAWWVRWLHTDEWDLPAARPGLASLCRQRLTAASVRSGGVLTRDGACLGIDRVTGKPAAVSWRAASGGGVLVTGAAQPAVLASGWQLAHAAIRRRKPVIVVDLAGHRELPAHSRRRLRGRRARRCRCSATDAALRYAPGHGPAEQDLAVLRASPLGRWLGPGPAAAARISLGEVVRRRAVVLFALDQRRYGRAAEVIANLVAADVAEVYAALGGDGIAPEGLCLVYRVRRGRPRGAGRARRPGPPGRARRRADHDRAGPGGRARRAGRRRCDPPAGGPGTGGQARRPDRYQAGAGLSRPGPGRGHRRRAAREAGPAPPCRSARCRSPWCPRTRCAGSATTSSCC